MPASMVTDPDIFANGQHLLTITGPRSHTTNEWTDLIAPELAPIRVDWRQIGGCQCFLFVGEGEDLSDAEIGRIFGVIERKLEDLRDMYMACTDNFTSHPERRDVQRLWV